MNRKAIVLLLFCGFVVGGPVCIAFSQEKPSPADTDTAIQTAAVVSIPGDDEFYVGKEKVTRADIPAKVKQVLKDTPPDEQVVYIKAMCPVKYGVVVSVIDALREAGFNRIGIVSGGRSGAGKQSATGTKSPMGPDKKVPNVAASSQKGSSLPPQGMETILIKVESKARVRLNSKAMSLPRLLVVLKGLLIGRSDKTAFIKAPKGMIYCDALKVVGVAKEAGAQPIGLQVDYLKEK